MLQVSYNTQANAMLCVSVRASATGYRRWYWQRLRAAGCDNDWTTWWVGSRTQWNVTSDFYMGVDVMYSQAEQCGTPTGRACSTTATQQLR